MTTIYIESIIVGLAAKQELIDQHKGKFFDVWFATFALQSFQYEFLQGKLLKFDHKQPQSDGTCD